MRYDRATVLACAAAGYEAVRALSARLGQIEPHFEQAPNEVQKKIVTVTVNVLENGHGPKEVHAFWFSMMHADGWTYGEVKNVATKSHPAMESDYAALPLEQALKNDLFCEVVQATARAQRAVPM
jgi:hypothetical protein